MNVYDYYDRIVEKNIIGTPLGSKGESRIIEYPHKTIIKRFPIENENIFHVNVQNLKTYGEVSFPDVTDLHTTIITKGNGKIAVNDIVHYVRARRKCYSVYGDIVYEKKPYYAKVKWFTCFSKSNVISNEFSKQPWIVSYFQEQNPLVDRYKFYFNDLFLHHHPDKEWALELDRDYKDFDYRIKTISKYKSLEDFLNHEHALKRNHF